MMVSYDKNIFQRHLNEGKEQCLAACEFRIEVTFERLISLSFHARATVLFTGCPFDPISILACMIA